MSKTLLAFTLIALMILLSFLGVTFVAPNFGYARSVAISIILGSVAGFYIYTIIDNNYLD